MNDQARILPSLTFFMYPPKPFLAGIFPFVIFLMNSYLC